MRGASEACDQAIHTSTAREQTSEVTKQTGVFCQFLAIHRHDEVGKTLVRHPSHDYGPARAAQ